MGSHAKNHGHQKRKNTVKTRGNYALFNRKLRDVEQREDQDLDSFANEVLRSTESGYLKRKNS